MIVACTHAGFGLAHVKLASTWAEHCPAYYVALNLQAKELLIAVRGTAQVEDVITDLTALPQVIQYACCLEPQKADFAITPSASLCNPPKVNLQNCVCRAFMYEKGGTSNECCAGTG